MVTSSGSPILDAIQKSVEETVAAETRRVSPRVGEMVEVRTASIPHTLPAPKPQPAPPQQRHVRPHPPAAKRGAKEARQQPRTTAAQLPVRAVHNTPSQQLGGWDESGPGAALPAVPPLIAKSSLPQRMAGALMMVSSVRDPTEMSGEADPWTSVAQPSNAPPDKDAGKKPLRRGGAFSRLDKQKAERAAGAAATAPTQVEKEKSVEESVSAALAYGAASPDSPPIPEAMDVTSAFIVQARKSAGVFFRTSPDMGARSEASVSNGTRVHAIQQTDEWVQVEDGRGIGEDRWLPKKFLVSQTSTARPTLTAKPRHLSVFAQDEDGVAQRPLTAEEVAGEYGWRAQENLKWIPSLLPARGPTLPPHPTPVSATPRPEFRGANPEEPNASMSSAVSITSSDRAIAAVGGNGGAVRSSENVNGAAGPMVPISVQQLRDPAKEGQQGKSPEPAAPVASDPRRPAT